MAEYIEREAANKAVCELCGTSEGTFCVRCDRNPLQAIPAADVVEVVRCRDCEFSRKPDRRKTAENRACEGTLICYLGFEHVYPDADDGLIFVDEYFYCAEGKRKDGGQDDV